MPRTRCCLWALAALVACVSSLQGQEGHPLVGSWHGVWAPAGVDGDGMDLTVIMDWDGRAVTGLINPVTDRAPLVNAELDSSDWTVRFEVDLEDEAGNPVRCVAEGRLDRLGSDRRTLGGTWNCGARRAVFELTRDRDY